MARWVPGRGHLANAKGPGQLKYFSKETLEGLDVSTAEVVASMEHLIALQAKDKAGVLRFSVLLVAIGFSGNDLRDFAIRLMLNALVIVEDFPVLKPRF